LSLCSYPSSYKHTSDSSSLQQHDLVEATQNSHCRIMKLFCRAATLATLLAISSSTIMAFTPVTSVKKNYQHSMTSTTETTTLRPTSCSATSLQMSTFAQQTQGLVDISVAATRDVTSFDEWALQCGVQRSPGFQFTAGDDMYGTNNLGVQTTEDLPAGSPVLFVPNQMIISASQAHAELGNSISNLSMVDEADLPVFYVFLKILKEYELGQDSPWYPWLNSLPRAYYNGAAMTEFCFDTLPPLAGFLAMKERFRFSNQFFQALAFVDDNVLSQETKQNRILARWAFSVAYTRGLPTPDGSDFKVVPMGDMFNHGTETQIDWGFDEEGNFMANSSCDVPAGSELCISYGDPTNPSHLLARYGFLDETSPASFCKILILDPSQELLDMGYDHSRMLFYRHTGDVSPEVWDVLCYKMLGEMGEYENQQALHQAQVSGDTDTKQAIMDHYYPQTAQALMEHVESFLIELDQLSARADGVDWKEHPRLPLILQHNSFVKQTFNNVRDNLMQMMQ